MSPCGRLPEWRLLELALGSTTAQGPRGVKSRLRQLTPSAGEGPATAAPQPWCEESDRPNRDMGESRGLPCGVWMSSVPTNQQTLHP